MRRSWRVWLVFVGVFLAGAVAGGFVSLRIAHRTGARPPPDDLALRMMQRFSDRLELTEAQRKVIAPHVERAASEMHRIRAQTAELMEQLEHTVSRELTPAQRETLEIMQAEQRERWKKWMEKKREMERKPAGAKPAPIDGPAERPPSP